jgi:predicted CopG family antitoxin
MTNRKNLKIAPDTYDKLRDEKRDMETWDSMLQRLLREREYE